MSTVIVTRHPALIDYLREQGFIEGTEYILGHAEAEDVRGQDVIGVLPLHLAVLCRTVTEIPLILAPEDRGQELSLERLREIAGPPRTYIIRDAGDVPSPYFLDRHGHVVRDEIGEIAVPLVIERD